MKKSEISLAIMVLKYGLDYLQYLWDPLIAFFMAEFPSQAHFLGLTHVSGQKRAPGHGTPFCALVHPPDQHLLLQETDSATDYGRTATATASNCIITSESMLLRQTDSASVPPLPSLRVILQRSLIFCAKHI